MAKNQKGAVNVVSANRLAGGEVVYLTAAGGWDASLAAATVASDEAEALRLLAVAEASVAARQVVEPYLVALVEQGVAGQPLSLRERIRAKGPTVAVIDANATRFPS